MTLELVGVSFTASGLTLVYFLLESSDFSAISDVSVLGSEASVSVVTINDAVTLEYDDQIILEFTPFVSNFIETTEANSPGVYIRARTTVVIQDSDRKSMTLSS